MDEFSRQFEADLLSILGQAGVNMEILARQTVQRVAREVVQATPARTGNLRAHWQPSLNAPSSAIEPGDPEARLALTVINLRLGQTFYMTNSAAYALRIEYGFVGADSLGRVYNQPGQFFVARTLAAWPAIATRVRLELES